MNDKFLWFMFAIGLVLLLGFAWAMVHLNDRTDWCDERGGLMVKSVSGWQCIDAKVIKR